MKVKPVVARQQADQDVEDAVAEDAETVALGFIDALEKADGHTGRHPGTGSPRDAHELHLPGLRSWPLTHCPDLVFYFEHPDRIDVWRVPHSKRDIPAWIQQPDGPSLRGLSAQACGQVLRFAVLAARTMRLT